MLNLIIKKFCETFTLSMIEKIDLFLNFVL